MPKCGGVTLGLAHPGGTAVARIEASGRRNDGFGPSPRTSPGTALLYEHVIIVDMADLVGE